MCFRRMLWKVPGKIIFFYFNNYTYPLFFYVKISGIALNEIGKTMFYFL